MIENSRICVQHQFWPSSKLRKLAVFQSL